eukprot:scaffold52301_cov43-Cyclotella_meneghiniana.AAC.2
MKSLTTTLLLSITAIASAETIVHHGIVGHFENIGPCPAHLMVPKCEDKAKWCEHLQMCTKPEGHCSRDGKGCVDIRFNRDVCVKPYNAYPGGTGKFEDCKYDEHGDGECHKVEFVPHHDHGL